jgi:hypothetical protein
MRTATGSYRRPHTHPSPSRGQTPAPPPSERIRLRAYEIYQARNGAPGDALGDWVQAEREFMAPQITADRIRGEELLHDPE